jgi:uncharacterized protein YxeA
MIKTIIIILLIISISFFIWYFINNQEKFSPCINCHLTSEEKENMGKYEEEKRHETETLEEQKTLLDFDDFRQKDTYTGDLDSILKSPEERKSFIPSENFKGQRDGYIFKKGRHGNGYYLDRHVQFNL